MGASANGDVVLVAEGLSTYQSDNCETGHV